jgi:hypothetical protein
MSRPDPSTQTTSTPPPKAEDLTGRQFGRLTVLGFSHKEGKYCYWLCQCDCGRRKITRPISLKSGDTQSCGHHSLGGPSRHGQHKTSLYQAWADMKGRCYNKKTKRYPHYGGRGIAVCEEWRDSFEAFAEHIGPKPSPRHSIDRIDNDRGYEPGNVRWATSDQQNRNYSRNRLVTIDGRTMCVTDWCQEVGLSPSSFWKRIGKGWDEKSAMLTPKDPKQDRKKKNPVVVPPTPQSHRP